MIKGRRKAFFSIVLLALAILVVGLPVASHVLSTDRHIGRKLHAWWVGAEYVGEEGVIRQTTDYDCGIACLQMVLAQRGFETSAEGLRELAGTNNQGTSLLGLARAAEIHGIQASSWRLSIQDLSRCELPVIAFVEGDHFAVVSQISNQSVIVLDPARGKLQYPIDSFRRCWSGEALVFGQVNLNPD